MRRTIAINEDKESDDEINLTPMLDVVFIMLIFFIVTASFVKETGIDVNRPEAAKTDPQEHANILVAINENSEIWIDNRLIDPRAVRATRIAHAGQRTAQRSGDRTVLRGHRR